MTMELSEAVSAVSALVRDAGDITGAQLSRALKGRLPDFNPRNYQAASLRLFIAQHVPSVVEVGRAGLDLIYRCPPIALQPTSCARANLWQTWVSPNAPFVLVIDRDQGEVTACARGTNPAAGVVHLAPPSVGFHRQMALDFLNQQPHTGDIDALRELAQDEQRATWWQPWFAAVRKMGLGKAWNTYRAVRLRNELECQLDQAALPHRAVEKALSVIHAPTQHSTSEQVAVATVDHGEGSALQRVAIATVLRMSDDELRELKLPLGLVLDAAGASR
jgi:hypothetical protein